MLRAHMWCQKVRIARSIYVAEKYGTNDDTQTSYLLVVVLSSVWTGHSNSLEMLKSDSQIETPSGLGALVCRAIIVC